MTRALIVAALALTLLVLPIELSPSEIGTGFDLSIAFTIPALAAAHEDAIPDAKPSEATSKTAPVPPKVGVDIPGIRIVLYYQ